MKRILISGVSNLPDLAKYKKGRIAFASALGVFGDTLGYHKIEKYLPESQKQKVLYE